MIIQGMAVPIPGDDIDTDRIVPARFLKELTFEHMGSYLFYDLRYDEWGGRCSHPLNDPAYAHATVMLVGANFGCGSSREHAAQAIQRAGFKAVVGVSFSEIFSSNCQSIGVPVVLLTPDDARRLMAHVTASPHDKLTLDLTTMTLSCEMGPIAINMPASRRQAFLTGHWDGLGLLMSNPDEVKEVANRLPYIQWGYG